MLAKKLSFLFVAVVFVTLSCDEDVPRASSFVHIDLSSLYRGPSIQQGGCASIAALVHLLVQPDGGERREYHHGLAPGETDVSFAIETDVGRVVFTANVVSNNGTTIYSGSQVVDVEDDGFTVELGLTSLTPVLKVCPDSLNVRVNLGDTLLVYNKGVDSLSWTIINPAGPLLGFSQISGLTSSSRPDTVVVLPLGRRDTTVVVTCVSGAGSAMLKIHASGPNLYGVFFIDANTGTAVGESGTILHTTNGGTTWTTQTSGTTNDLYGVSFTNAFTATAVGASGTIRRTTNGGITWAAVASGTMNTLYAVSFDMNTGTGTAVGASGTILRSSDGGFTWAAVASGTTNDLRAVSLVDANTWTVVGAAGTIRRTTNGGVTWTTQTSGTINDLYGVTFTSTSSGTVVGGSGTIRRTTNAGATWTVSSGGTTNDLYAVSFVVAVGTVVGGSGTIIGTGNGVWAPQPSGTTHDLFGVFFTSFNTGTVVGESGIILHTTDGGTTWVEQ